MKDLRDFIVLLEKEKEMVRIKSTVSKDLEITEITNRVSKAPPEKNKALFFEKVEGSKIPILTNIFGSEKRICLCFGIENLLELERRVLKFVEMLPRGGIFDFLGKGMELMRIFRSLFSFQTVEKAPCQEVIYKENATLEILPIMKLWPKDGGPYITLPQVITYNPQTKKRNVGMYRLQLLDEKRLAVHWQFHKNGREHEEKAKILGIRHIPSACVIGGDPLCIWVACLPLPLDIDEYMVVSFLRERPLEMVKCVTQPIYVPAHAEIVIEGYIDIEEKVKEGPFGDHTGFYDDGGLCPVFHVTAITMRKDPIYVATVTGIPPMEDFWMGKAVERIALPFLRFLLPEIKDISMPSFGVFHNLLFVSIEKRYPGQARKVINALWGIGLLSLTKAIIVVDKEIDLTDPYRVLWYALGNVDWTRDIIIAKGPCDELDHATERPLFGGKIGIDATRKMREEGYERKWPEIVEMDEQVIKKVNEKWASLGLFSLP